MGGEFKGWRYASTEEVITFWSNLGMPTFRDADLHSGTIEYSNFPTAVDLLGNRRYIASSTHNTLHTFHLFNRVLSIQNLIRICFKLLLINVSSAVKGYISAVTSVPNQLGHVLK